MSETVERRVERLEEDGQVIQDLVSQLLESARETSRQVRRLTMTTGAVRDRLGRIDSDVVAIKNDTAGLRDDMANLKEDLAGVEGDVTTVKDNVLALNDRFENFERMQEEILRRLPAQD